MTSSVPPRSSVPSMSAVPDRQPGGGRPTRVLLADDHTLVRRGVRLILDGEPDLSVVAEAGDGAEAVARARDTDVDLAVLDISMPWMTGLQAARELSRRLPDLRILILTMYDNEQYFFEALKAGACGYVLKSVADRDLVEACRAAMRDEPFIYPGAETALVGTYLERMRRGEALPVRTVTDREEEVLKLVAEGHTTKEIAELLYISAKTVESHRATCCRSSACATASNSPGTRSGPGSSSHDPGRTGNRTGKGPTRARVGPLLAVPPDHFTVTTTVGETILPAMTRSCSLPLLLNLVTRE